MREQDSVYPNLITAEKGFSSSELKGASSQAFAWPSWHRVKPVYFHREIPSLMPAWVGQTQTETAAKIAAARTGKDAPRVDY